MTLTFKPVCEEYSGDVISVKANTFSELVAEFHKEMSLIYGHFWIATAVLKALAEVSEAHDNGEGITVEHRDFSAPEEQFDLVFNYE